MFISANQERLGRGRHGMAISNTGGGAVSYGAYADAVLALSPTGYWPLWETTGTSGVDLAGTRTVTYSGVTLANRAGPGASMGSAPLCDNAGSTISFASLTGLANVSFTISVWGYSTSTSGTPQRLLFSIFESGSANKNLQMYGFSTSLRINDGATLGNFTSQVATGAWVNWIWTYNQPGDTSTVYKNNSSIGTSATGPYTGGNAPSCTITSATAGWDGNLAHAAIWVGRVLSAGELTTVSTAA